jgi:hypothetical protein
MHDRFLLMSGSSRPVSTVRAQADGGLLDCIGAHQTTIGRDETESDHNHAALISPCKACCIQHIYAVHFIEGDFVHVYKP